MASGSQVCRKNCADLPMAPTNSSAQARSISRQFWPANAQVMSAWPATCGKIWANWIEPSDQNTVMMPSAKPKSPTRLTTKALIAAALAVGLWYQKPIRGSWPGPRLPSRRTAA